MAGALAALLATGGGAAAATDGSYLWVLRPELNLPVSLQLTLVGIAACDAGRRFCLDFPLWTIGADLARPSSSRQGSLSLSFVQAPIFGHAAMMAIEGDSAPLKGAALFLAWLSGGSFRWAPGGEGNLKDQARDRTTLAVVLKNEVAFHAFVRPAYVRALPGVGLALTRYAWRDGIPGVATFGVGAFLGVAAEDGGRRTFEPGVWLTCQFTGD